MSAVLFLNKALEKEVREKGGGRWLYLSHLQKYRFSETSLIPRNIKGIIKKIMTHYSVPTKDNKRNGIDCVKGELG